MEDNSKESKWNRIAGCCDCCGNFEICNDGQGRCEEADRANGHTSINPKCGNSCMPCNVIPKVKTPGFFRMSREDFLLMII